MYAGAFTRKHTHVIHAQVSLLYCYATTKYWFLYAVIVDFAFNIMAVQCQEMKANNKFFFISYNPCRNVVYFKYTFKQLEKYT